MQNSLSCSTKVVLLLDETGDQQFRKIIAFKQKSGSSRIQMIYVYVTFIL